METTKKYFVAVLWVISTACSGGSDSASGTHPVSTPLYDPQPICAIGEIKSCNTLATLWASGTATCAEDRFSFDVSGCVSQATANARRVVETVYPAERDERWKNAKCNYDGNFVFQISYPQHPDGTWIIQLEGGGFCTFDGTNGGDGDGDCTQREVFKLRPVKSSNIGGVYPYFPSDGDVGADPESTDPDWGNAIMVKANYCSSDLWTGTNTDGVMIHYDAPVDENGVDDPPSYKKWPFTGHINFESMMDILKERYGLDDNNPDIAIHFRGQSAGGWGVINNSWNMKARYPKIASRGNLMLSSWEGYIPEYWDDPNFPMFGITDPQYLTEQAGFKMMMEDTWKSQTYPTCLLFHINDPQACLFGNTMYDFITGSEAVGGLDLPLYVFQNRQDQLYMSLMQIPYMSNSINAMNLDARDRFVTQMNAVMGITIENKSDKIKWLYAPSDPDWENDEGKAEPNVHPPLCYEYDSPEGSDKSVDEHTRRFWHTKGKGPGRGKLPGEVITWDVNFVTLETGGCE